MSAALFLVIVVAAAYLAAHVAFEWIGRRYLIVSGAEYLVLGILIGPEVSGLLSNDTITSFSPIMMLGVGWMGAMIGTRFLLPELVKVSGLSYRLAFVESLLTLTVVSALEVVALMGLFDMTLLEAFGPAVALGAIATASSTAGIEFIAKRVGNADRMVRQLRVSNGANAFVAICTFGILLASRHREVPGMRPFTPTEWTVISIAIGVIGGGLFYLFLGDEEKMDRLFVSLAGAIIVVSGAAAYLHLSPLLSTMFFGAMLANTSKSREEIGVALARVERPLYFVLLILAGASWHPSVRSWILPVTLFIAARAAGKIGGARLASRLNDVLPVLGPDWGRGLLGQGGLALAIGINYLYQDTLPIPNIVFTAAVASVLLTDLSSARFVRSVLLPPMLGPEPKQPEPEVVEEVDDVEAEQRS